MVGQKPISFMHVDIEVELATLLLATLFSSSHDAESRFYKKGARSQANDRKKVR